MSISVILYHSFSLHLFLISFSLLSVPLLFYFSLSLSSCFLLYLPLSLIHLYLSRYLYILSFLLSASSSSIYIFLYLPHYCFSHNILFNIRVTFDIRFLGAIVNMQLPCRKTGSRWLQNLPIFNIVQYSILLRVLDHIKTMMVTAQREPSYKRHHILSGAFWGSIMKTVLSFVVFCHNKSTF